MVCSLSDSRKFAIQRVTVYGLIRSFLSVGVEKGLDPRVGCGTRLSIGADGPMQNKSGTQPRGPYKGSARIVGKL
jgi:hypothetical protein